MKKLITVIVLSAMAISLCSCGNVADTDKTATTETTAYTPGDFQADINPFSLDWGWHSEDENLPSGTSDMWYPEDDDSGKNYVYFTQDEKIVICTDGEEKSFAFTVNENYHLLPKDKAEIDFDIVFTDYFSFRNYVNDQCYSRGNAEDYEKKLLGIKFERKIENGTSMEFKADKKVNVSKNGHKQVATWYFIAQKTIRVIFTDGYEMNYYLSYDTDGTVLNFCDNPLNLTNAYTPVSK